jgi:hypothetical protein
MWFQVALMICTGFFTVLAVLSTRQAAAFHADCVVLKRTLLKQATQHELLVEEFEAVKKRQHKLAGRFFRDLRRDTAADEPSDPDLPVGTPRDPRTRDFVNGSDDEELAALIALQSGSSPK